MTEDQKRHVFALANRLRICGNALTADLQKRYDQMIRTKLYKILMDSYKGLKKKCSSLKEGSPAYKKNKQDMDAALKELNKLYKYFGLTFDYARSRMIEIADQYSVDSIFALARAEDVWTGMEKVLFGTGKRLRFKQRGDLPIIRAKQINRAITIKVKDSCLCFCMNNKIKPVGQFTALINPKDVFECDEISRIIQYLNNPDEIENRAVQIYHSTGICLDTYRPCYAALKCEIIRGKLRVFIHITVDGLPAPKYRFDRESQSLVFRHNFSKKGRIGIDIGTQSIAVVSEGKLILKNLAERNGNSPKQYEKKKSRLRRKMDRSRRMSNPENYKDNGIVKPRKERLPWKYSKGYRRVKNSLHELERKAAASRKYANQEEVNRIRSMGDVIITEPSNAKQNQKKAKKSKVIILKNGRKKNTRRKRFGKSVYHRAPGSFQAGLKKKFENGYHEVSKMYRASQYDLTIDEYIKKELGDRIYLLSNKTQVQRDLYSAFLLYCSDNQYDHPDKSLCDAKFDDFLKLQAILVNKIARSGQKVCNSGITQATFFSA